ncbi:PLP-dependent aminotransferase family protein [Vibrio fluvialis]|nr:PLP-dependent aminotransferase family protein [Vibrio fluvialis]
MSLSLNLKPGKITSKSLYAAIRQGIADGRLQPNEKLPSTRQLSKQLGIARNTVISVYERMHHEGWVIQKMGSGTYVAETEQNRLHAAKEVTKKHPVGAFAKRLTDNPNILDAKGLTYDFALGVPEHQHIANHIWRHSRLSRLNRLTPEFALNSDVQGLACLRESICEYVRHSRGVHCTPDNIIITQGCQQALMITLMTLLSPGEVVAMEDPGYPVFRHQANMLGAHVADVPMDEQGVILESIAANAKILYTTPSHQFPLGFAYTKKRKSALLRWAERNQAIIIEDDYDAEYHYLKTNRQALKSQDKKDCVVMIGSFSKILFPGIRIGYIIPPESLLKPMTNILWHLGRNTSVVSQILLDEFMRDGHFSHHLLNMNKVYSERYHKLTALIDSIDGLNRIPSQGGLHVAANVSGSALTLANKLALSDIGVYPSSHFSNQSQSNALLFGFGRISVDKIEKAFSLIRTSVK